MIPLFLIVEPGGLRDHLAGRQAGIGQAGQSGRQMPGRPAAQRGNHRLAGITGYRVEPRQQRDQPGQRLPGLQVVIPVGRVHRLPVRLVVPVTQVTQRRMHRLPQPVGDRQAVLAKHREQRQRQQPDAVFILRVRLRRAHRAQGRQPPSQQVRTAGGPALQRRTGDHPAAADLQQARRDRGAPGPVQRRDVGHRAQSRRHVHTESRTRSRHVGLTQHLAGRHLPAARSDPAGQQDGMTHDPAFPRLLRRITKITRRNRYVHIGTLLPAAGSGLASHVRQTPFSGRDALQRMPHLGRVPVTMDPSALLRRPVS
jgi:hypothetical protein